MINAAEHERAAAKGRARSSAEVDEVTDAAIYAMIDSLGDIGATLSDARPERLSKLYDAVGLELRYTPDDQVVYVSTTLRVANECIRGRSCTLFTRCAIDR